MGRGLRPGYEADVTFKPRMWLAEGSKAEVWSAEKTTMKLASMTRPNQQAMIRDLQRAAAAQAERLHSAELELSRTRDCVAAVTRKLGEKEAEAERAERARGRLAGELELSRQELREKEAVNEGLLSRLGEKDAARSQAVENAQRVQQELAAARCAMREKDAAIERLRADQQKLLLQAQQEEAAHARAELAAACREACATAQRAREAEQRITELENSTVDSGGSPERRPSLLPSGPAGSPESSVSSRDGSNEACSNEAYSSVSSALTSVGASDTLGCIVGNVAIIVVALLLNCIPLRRDLLMTRGEVLRAVQRQNALRARVVAALQQTAHLPQRGDLVVSADRRECPAANAAARGPCRSQVVPRARNQKNSCARALMKKARSPERVTASFAFNIDTIGFRLAELVPAAWAPVRRKAADDVLLVHRNRIACWRMAATFSFRMQAGDKFVARGRVDEVGPTVAAKRAFEELKASVQEIDSGTEQHVMRFLRRIQMVLCIFEQYHLEMQDVNRAAHATCVRLATTHNEMCSTLLKRRAA